ncbi:MAG: bifunctional folylpolyglutamate synthase/dihydrofolate synthase [Rhodospirillales bacterium]|nr:bifunctional folylpolyglutamate synthase/dihydrofolate synthase [Rhodospirillales bacterium]
MVDAILARLLGLHPKVIDLSLDRVRRLLAALGNPEEGLPPVIHIAGTNGKGSVVAFLRAILEAAGLRAHAYTSPHLVRFNERIRIAGEIISDERLLAVLEECERANAGQPITFFEITTAAAFLAFARTTADVVILETGLGGSLDATNVVRKPALTALTPISLDHQQYLGGHIEAIAGEKAGIMKRGVACVVADQERKANKIIEARSLEYGVPLWKEGADFFVRSSGDGFVYQSKGVTWTLPTPALLGQHQLRNAGLALACIERLDGFAVPPSALALGMRTVQWPARLQRLQRGPLAAALPAGWELWLDGGHNPAAGKALAAQGRAWREAPLYAVFGMLNSKDPQGFLKPLAPRLAALRAVTIPGEANSLTAADAAAAARAQGVYDCAPADDVAAAVADLVSGRYPPGRILICGSLYLAGTVLAENG